jgi:hypothetical protein
MITRFASCAPGNHRVATPAFDRAMLISRRVQQCFLAFFGRLKRTESSVVNLAGGSNPQVTEYFSTTFGELRLSQLLVPDPASRRDADKVETRGEWQWRFRQITGRPVFGRR